MAALAGEGGNRPEPFVEAAAASYAAGRWGEAQSILEQGLARHPDEAPLLELRGRVLANLGYRRAAELDFQRAVVLEPESAELWRLLGQVRLELDLPAAANKALRQCDALEPGDPETLFLLGRASRLCGERDRAWGLYQQALESEAATPAQLVEGATLYTEDALRQRRPHDLPLAYQWLHRALARDPDHARAHFVRGLLLEMEGKLENAAASYRRALEADPGGLGACTNLALVYHALGRAGEAEEMARRALALEDDEERRELLSRIAERY